MNIAKMYAEQICFGEELTLGYTVKEERKWVITLRALGVGVMIVVYIVGFYLILLWQRWRERWKTIRKRD